MVSSVIIAPIEDRRLTGIAMMMLACLLFTGIDTCAKWLVLAGVPPMTVVFVRYFVHMFMVAALFLPSQGGRMFSTKKPGLEIARGLALLIGTILNFTAVKYLPLTLTSAIMFTIPLWVCALSIPLLGEHVGWRRWIAIIVGFCGALITTQFWNANFHWAVMLSMGTALSASAYAILTRKLAGVDSTSTQQFYAASIASVGMLPVAALDWQWPVGGIDWLAFALIGVFGFTGHQLLTTAHRYAPASTLAPFMYAQMFYMTLSSWLIFHQPPDVWVLTGASLVLCSGLYIWLREKRLAKVVKTHSLPMPAQ
jgi:drug/metabolite transporter (DMT)-like permease